MILFKHATMLAPAPLGQNDVLVGGGQILAIAPSLPSLPPGVPHEVVDLHGGWLVPGLVDGHAHLGGGGGEGGAHTRVPAVQLTALTTAGVTTVVGLLGTDCTTRSVADLLAAARGLDHLGISAYCYTGGYVVPPVTLTGGVRGDITHVDRIIAVGETAISDHRSSQPTFDELVRIAADAHVAGMMTGKAGCLHLHLGDGPRGLELVWRALRETELPARVFHPTHCNRNRRLWEEAKRLTSAGVTVDITAFAAEDDAPSAGGAITEWSLAGLPPERLTLSSDGGGCLPTFAPDGTLRHMDVGSPSSLMDAVREAVSNGVSLTMALATVTLNPATQLRLHRKGRIAPGADADLVALDADLRVTDVWARGVSMVRNGAAVVRGPFER